MAKILIVDDASSIRQMVSLTLKMSGYEFEEATDGVQGLQLAKQQKFDLVLTDVNMPNMDGITLCSELRKLSDYKFVPILILTTEAGGDKKSAGKAAGATGWLVKPFDPEKLIATINKVL